MANFSNVAGWDIGGAHLKMALRKKDVLRVFQWHCPLWKGMHELEHCLHEALKHIPVDNCLHHITMTGELVDIFTDRQQGVKKIINTFMQSISSHDQVKIYSDAKLVDVEYALKNTHLIASANWLASGQLLAQFCKDALFIDMGSTTTDLLMIKDGKVCNYGFSDSERLRSGELVYTGVVRSCVNTICSKILIRGQLIPMMAENFAASADIYRILEILPEHADSGVTMDGQSKDKIASMRRLARMIGEDFQVSDTEDWRQAAKYIAKKQRQRIAEQAQQLLSKLDSPGIIVAAGVGRFLIKQLAEELNVQYYDFAEIALADCEHYDMQAADCAPAVSLALH